MKLVIGGAEMRLSEAAQFYAGLHALFFPLLDCLPERKLRDLHIRDALPVSVRNLKHLFLSTSGLTEIQLNALLNVATFAGKSDEVLWFKPLLPWAKDERLVFLPALKASMLRTINWLMDEFAENASDKGIAFEQQCRTELASCFSAGPLGKISWVSSRAVEFWCRRH